MLKTNPSLTQIWNYVSDLLGLMEPLRHEGLACDDVHGVRNRVRKRLKETHEFLASFLSERDAYYVLFALVAHFDEIAQVHVQTFKNNQGWEPLQYELFGITEAGELFYGYAESFRGRNDIPQIIFEIYFFCINDGFKGRYIIDPDTLEIYRKELAAYIQPAAIVPTAVAEGTIGRRHIRPARWMYYAALFVFFLVLDGVLSSIPLKVSTTL